MPSLHDFLQIPDIAVGERIFHYSCHGANQGMRFFGAAPSFICCNNQTFIGGFCSEGLSKGERYRVARLKELDAALTESQKLTEQLTQQGTELRKANHSLELEAAVTSNISESSTLAEAAPKILQAICQVSDWQAGELWEVETQTRSMRCVAVWQTEVTRATPEAYPLNAPDSVARGIAAHNGTNGESLQVSGHDKRKGFPASFFCSTVCKHQRGS